MLAVPLNHIPTRWATLLENNELELYDLQADPDELKNLGRLPEHNREVLTRMNAKTSALIVLEVGEDLGAEQFGPDFRYRL